jgi:hypothetical protein
MGCLPKRELRMRGCMWWVATVCGTPVWHVACGIRKSPVFNNRVGAACWCSPGVLRINAGRALCVVLLLAVHRASYAALVKTESTHRNQNRKPTAKRDWGLSALSPRKWQPLPAYLAGLWLRRRTRTEPTWTVR